MIDFESAFTEIEAKYKNNPQREMFQRISVANTKIVIFGAGDVAELVLSLLALNHSNLFAFCDNFKTGLHAGTKAPILSPAELVETHKDAVVIIAASSAQSNDEMYHQLVGMGFPKPNIFRSYGDTLIDMDVLKKKYLDGYKWAYDFFTDEKSKSIIIDRISGYLFGFNMNPSPWQGIYFPDDIGFKLLSNEEVFIDGGSYDGAITIDFMARTHGEYKHIYAFEPDTNNHRIAMSNLSIYNNIEVLNAGLWHTSGEISFLSDRGQGSCIDENAESKIQTISLDEFFLEKPESEWPTFIKADIEGAEKSAIEGAREIIKHKHPKLAISAYHKPEDIYILAQLIYSINPCYKFSLRHYTKGFLETVLYAI